MTTIACSIRLSEEDEAYLTERAKRLRTTRSALLKNLVVEKLAELRKEPLPEPLPPLPEHTSFWKRYKQQIGG